MLEVSFDIMQSCAIAAAVVIVFAAREWKRMKRMETQI